MGAITCLSSAHADHICHPENDRRRCQVMTAERLLNTSELREAAANLEAVTGITPGALEALHRHELEAWHRWMDQDTYEYRHEAWYQKWREADLQRHQAVQRQAVLDWAHVRRGSDLFVRGLGGFNIDVAVCESLADIFHSNYWNCRARSFYSSYFPSEHSLARIARREQAERSLRYQHTWVLRPRDLQARGHFAALDRLSNLDQQLWIDSALQPATNLARLGWILALPDDHPIRCHLIRFHSYWACPDNANTLHELVEAAESLSVANVRQVGPRRATLLGEAGVSSMIDLAHLDDDRQARVVENCTADYRSLPKRVLQTLVQNAAAELPRRWPAELTAGTKPLTLLRRLRELQQARLVGPDVYFAHLDSLADGPINAYGEQMQVLRSKHAIVQTAARLSNCAASYATFVEHKEYVLICLVDTTTGAPKALGGAYVVRDLTKEETASLRTVDGDPASLRWDQIVERKNRGPSLATRNAFDAYLSWLWASEADKQLIGGAQRYSVRYFLRPGP